jgi:diguanylate cyclase (GGDEF)-like protein/PAS domain S-box-containing protein
MKLPRTSLPTSPAPSWQPTVVLLSLLGGLLLFIWLVPLQHPLEALSHYLPFHTIIEMLTVVIAALIFVMGWHIYVFSRAMNVVLIACAFLAIALLDAGHLMSHVGMPDFITASSTSKSTAFWLTARFIAAIGLFASVLTSWKPLSSFHSSYITVVFFVLYTVIAYWLILFHFSALPETFVDGTGFTPFKVIAEYLIALIHIASGVMLLLLMGNRLTDNEFSRNLFIALYIMALSELCFMLNANVTDIYSLVGHLFKILAYLYLYKAILNISVKIPLDQLQKATNLLAIEKELAQITLNSIGDAVITTDIDGAIIMLNPIAESLTGWTQQEAAGLPLDEVFNIVNPVTRRPVENPATRAINNCGMVIDDSNNLSLLLSRDNHEYSIEYSASPIRNNEGFVLGCVLTFHNITEKRQLIEQISWQAGHDTLTKLPNRTLLSDRINQAIAHAQRQEQLLLVCFMDLDGFKAVNDQYGHEMGDKLLIEVAHRLTTVVRGDDTVSRLGGDEFVLLLSELRSADEVDILITRVLEEMARPFPIGNETLKISASVGATIFPFDSSDTDTLLRHADQAMYQAKQSGRNRFHLFDASMDHQVQNHHLQLARLEFALSHNELCMHYQPKVNLKNGSIVGMEALLRWQHPEKGLLGPRDFLRLAEDSNLIIDIGNWVLDEALNQIEKWSAAGNDWVVSINIAARQLQRFDFVDTIQSILARHPNVSASRLEFEILESTALDDMDHVHSIILECQSMGITISLDDFGSGYSSLAYLRHLPVNTLKIDQSFVRDMLDDEEDCALVEGILQMARVFKRDVIAEGMETAAHGALLLKLGCNTAQGNGIARPMPPDQILPWAAQFKPDPSWQNYPAVLVGWGRASIEKDKVTQQSELSL